MHMQTAQLRMISVSCSASIIRLVQTAGLAAHKPKRERERWLKIARTVHSSL